MIELDGSTGEGGGSIVRMAVALSTLTQKAVSIKNIRAGRPQPGLKEQHLNAVEAVARLCNARTSGLKLGSKTLEFVPGQITAKTLEVTIKTAGSIGLALQPLLIAACAAEQEVQVHVRGGATFGKWAPPIYYLKYVMAPLLAKMGYSFDISIEKHGFYPKGGADVKASMEPAKLKPLELLEPGKALAVKGISVASNHLKKAQVAERMASAASERLSGLAPEIGIEYVEATCPGCGIQLWKRSAHSVVGADGLGELGKKAETVGEEAAQRLVSENAAVDRHAADQLIPFLAIAGGKISTSEITNHTKTNIWVAQQFMEKEFSINENVIEVR